MGSPPDTDALEHEWCPDRAFHLYQPTDTGVSNIRVSYLFGEPFALHCAKCGGTWEATPDGSWRRTGKSNPW